MNRKSLPMLTMFALLLLSTLVLSTIVKNSYAQDLTAIDVKINHLVTVYESGFTTINDTVTLSKKPGGTPPTISDFQIGFPQEFKFNVYQIFAFDSQSPQQQLTVALDTGLGVEGFYGVKVHFRNDVDLNVESFSFTVVFEFSGLVTENITDVFLFNFPVYPSLTQEASVSSTTIILPPNANFTAGSHNFTQTSSNTLTIEKQPLDAFTLEIGRIRFEPGTSFGLLDVDDVKRDIMLNEWNELLVSDVYAITNRGQRDVSTVWAFLPPDASDISARDEISNVLTTTHAVVGNVLKETITLKTPVTSNQTVFYLVSFKLPWKDHIAENDWNDYALDFKLFEPMNMTVKKVSVSVELPEGADFQSSTASIQPDIVQNGIYGKNAIYTLSNVSSYQNFDFTVGYKHVVFWSSFRITLWTGALVAIVGAVAFIWNTRKAQAVTPGPTTALPIHPEDLRNYVKTYEEQRKILKERESLEAQARKGRIPRRLYKVRTRTLDSRVSLLSKDLATLRDKIRAAGPRYADMMRQIEVAQTELQGVEADIRRAEARYKRGEISAAAYHKLLEDYYKRRDRAQTNIEGILLRLREETS